MTFEPVWGAPIAWYLFLAGLGAGAYISSAFLRWKHPNAIIMRRAGHVIAPVSLIVGLILLMFDAEAGFHNPLRFGILLHNPQSVMSWGVVFLAIFSLISFIVVAFDHSKKHIPAWLDIVGVFFACCVAIYTGALLGVCKTFPLWNSALLPILFLVSALSTGAASVLLFGAVKCHEEFNRLTLAKNVHFILPLIEILLLLALLFLSCYVSPAGKESVLGLLCGDWALLFWIGLIAVGLVLPSILDAWLLFGQHTEFETSSQAHVLSAAGNAGVLLGGYLLRYLIIVAAQPLTYVM